ncbi:phosphonate C-P lyase system protein PhnH [uncultured Cohaesibacter sp.]|uniref:phosphonate C-P lyase system protein PhnH n=1 Tax=uncultured Cohaesibacter sp. TaxID=1002546 RepID=UPI0029C73A38|nr:phosphonate C-P lyase system protein PhnH [uncultured Cohaesibacter sp.]
MTRTSFGKTQPDASLEAMQGGLGEPIYQSQRIFRSLMDAMACPGTIKPVATDARPPFPMFPLTAAVLATMADADTPVWLDGTMKDNGALKDWLTFHVGAPLADEPDVATFAVLSGKRDMPPLESFAKGLQDYPDRSATLLIQVERLGNKPDWSLSGPGIKDTQLLTVSQLSPLFVAQWQENHKLFPRGVDVVFIAPDAIVCLPRTTAITLGHPASSDKQDH